ncbi:MAG: hypothetical protein ACYCZK_04245 [Microbacteriaceae bacterium]
MTAAMHACLFLVIAAILTLLASPALRGRVTLPAPPMISARRQHTRALRDVDRSLTFCVLRI